MPAASHPAVATAVALRGLAQSTVATSRTIVADTRRRLAAARATRAASSRIVASRRPSAATPASADTAPPHA
jgi:hypothetical protein